MSTRALLLVEDDPLVARAVVRALSRRGFVVVVVTSLSGAMATQRVFDVGVFDIKLGDGSGVDCAARMLKSARVGRAVFYTGGASVAEMEAAGRLGAVVMKGAIDQLIGILETRHPASPT